MQELYTKATFAGDEDTGSMAAWFVLSSLGIYPSCPGRADYTLGSPLFDKAKIHLDGGKTLLIEATQNSQTNVFVKAVNYNGEAITKPTIDHASLVSGGKLIFDMFAG